MRAVVLRTTASHPVRDISPAKSGWHNQSSKRVYSIIDAVSKLTPQKPIFLHPPHLPSSPLGPMPPALSHRRSAPCHQPRLPARLWRS